MRIIGLTSDFLSSCGLPKKYHFSKPDLIKSDNKDFFDRFFDNPLILVNNGYGALFYGENKTGKTAASAVMFRKVRETDGMSCFFTTAFNYIISFNKNKMFDASITFENRCKTVKFLVIDDFGKEGNSYFDAQTLAIMDDLIRTRASNLLSTVITTNLSPEKIGSYYGDSILSIFAESFTFVRFSDKTVFESVVLDMEKSFH